MKPDGGVAVVAGVLGGVAIFVAISVCDWMILIARSGLDFQSPICQRDFTEGIVQVLLSIVTGFIAWTAIFRRGIFRNAYFGWRVAAMAASALLLVPSPCSFTGLAAVALCAVPGTH